MASPATPIAVSRGTKPLDVTDVSTETLLAVVPTWRRDISIEADVAEEIARHLEEITDHNETLLMSMIESRAVA